ncbi:MAG: hypothetical protein HYY37_05830 [Candidatus Aenigmarchaeota archaeon]|nr:hypothetical protein [Candidatus Aenigmarchaeota archaeon]
MYVIAELTGNRRNGLQVPSHLREDFQLVMSAGRTYLVSGQLGSLGTPENAQRIRRYADDIRELASEHGYRAAISFDAYRPFISNGLPL